MDVLIPVYLYDVTTTATPPRLIVTCRTADVAQELASRLNAMQAEGKLGSETFTAASPRSVSITMTVVPGSSIAVQGYQVAADAVAVRLNAAPVII